MAVFDIGSMQAEQNQVKDYIVSALREFPEVARQMGTPTVGTRKKNYAFTKTVDSARNDNDAYVLAIESATKLIALSISANGYKFGGLAYKGSFYGCALRTRQTIGKIVTPETVADYIIENVKIVYVNDLVSVDNIEAAKTLFEQALRGKPMEVTL